MNAQHHLVQLLAYRPVFVILDKSRQTTAIPAVTRGLLDHFQLNHPGNDENDLDHTTLFALFLFRARHLNVRIWC